uniref:Uncharacterized protein n=1 Tax=Romanomermis culicivorax TaxID=13658 RepID=A0A915KEE3_ROMCU
MLFIALILLVSTSTVENADDNFHAYNYERFKHVELYQSYTGDYGYLKRQLVMCCSMSKEEKIR